MKRLQSFVATRDLDALMLFKPENSFYVSNFSPILYTHPVVAIVPRSGTACLLVHALRDDHAKEATWLDDVHLFGRWANKVALAFEWQEALARILNDLGLSAGKIGIEDDFLSLAHMNALQAALPKAQFSPAGGIMRDARMIKDELEIKNARTAARIADLGTEAALEGVADRLSEREASIRAMAAMNQEWTANHPDIEVHGFSSLESAVHNALWCWVLYGKRVLLNADNPTARKPQEGEIAMVNVYATCNGIFAENERGVAVGEVDKEKRRGFEAILKIREKAFGKLMPGVAIRDVYLAARDEYVAQGLERRISGRIGHSIGLGLHEHPAIDSEATEVLQPGMMVTIEPALRVPEWGGMQHSDTVLITETGYEVLTQTRRDYLRV